MPGILGTQKRFPWFTQKIPSGGIELNFPKVGNK
jgi:hypothetical protein